MDDQRFDHLARGFVRADWTRRGLATVFAGGVLSLLGVAPTTEARKRRKKKKRKKKPAPSPTTCTGAPPCAAGCRDCGSLCIPDDDEHCCNLADCGGQFSSLFCDATTHRCECEISGWGRCTGQDRFLCAPCCPGSDFDIGERCAGANDEVICVDRTSTGCRCPDAAPVICSAHNQIKCSFDTNRDPRVCGLQSCRDCGPTGLCCGGNCVGGCPAGTGGSCASGPCNADCSPCPQGSTCCNFGSGSQCYEGMGTTCFPP
jgi:hypothetical protein